MEAKWIGTYDDIDIDIDVSSVASRRIEGFDEEIVMIRLFIVQRSTYSYNAWTRKHGKMRSSNYKWIENQRPNDKRAELFSGMEGGFTTSKYLDK